MTTVEDMSTSDLVHEGAMWTTPPDRRKELTAELRRRRYPGVAESFDELRRWITERDGQDESGSE